MRERLNPPPPAAGNERALDTLIGEAGQPPPAGHQHTRIRRMRVTWGDETIQPVQYNVFHTGAIEVEVELMPGEDPTLVHAQTYELLERLGTMQYRLKRDAFLARLADTAQTVRTSSAKNSSR